MTYDAASAPTAIIRSVPSRMDQVPQLFRLSTPEQHQGFGSHFLKVGAVPVSPLVLELYRWEMVLIPGYFTFTFRVSNNPSRRI